jgi:hypothetical protein
MSAPVNNADRYLKAADEYFERARNAPSPFVKAYYERVALRCLSSKGELRRCLGASPVICLLGNSLRIPGRPQ